MRIADGRKHTCVTIYMIGFSNRDGRILCSLINPKYVEWHSPCLDLEHTTNVCRGEGVNTMSTASCFITRSHFQ